MKIKTTKNLIAFFALAFFFAGAGSALAYVPGVWDYQPRIQTNEPAFYKVPITYDAPVVPQTSTTTYTPVSTPKKAVATTTSSTTTTKKSTTSSNTSNASRELKPIVTEEQYNNNGLTALSLAGSGSFMPSSIWQWLLVIFLILVIIIIARMLGKSRTHEVHTVTAH